jgi:DNA-directed RNA polymerase specialized sigma24 family protein
VFVLQLARAASKKAQRFLASRGLQHADRDDVIAAAMLWCWENRDSYSLTTTLETWFMNAIRDAYKALRRGELPVSDESIERLGGGDTTYESAAAESAAEAISRTLTRAERRVAVLTMEGYTKANMLDRGVREIDIRESRATIRRLRELLPDDVSYRVLVRTPPASSSDDTDDRLSEIDVAIEQLEFAPPAGKDCPPCWRCMYFEGFMPAGKRETRMEIADVEVREAVKVTEARKIEIAQQVRRGLCPRP